MLPLHPLQPANSLLQRGITAAQLGFVFVWLVRWFAKKCVCCLYGYVLHHQVMHKMLPPNSTSGRLQNWQL